MVDANLLTKIRRYLLENSNQQIEKLNLWIDVSVWNKKNYILYYFLVFVFINYDRWVTIKFCKIRNFECFCSLKIFAYNKNIRFFLRNPDNFFNFQFTNNSSNKQHKILSDLWTRCQYWHRQLDQFTNFNGQCINIDLRFSSHKIYFFTVILFCFGCHWCHGINKAYERFERAKRWKILLNLNWFK